jgi:hypothetical protein
VRARFTLLEHRGRQQGGGDVGVYRVIVGVVEPITQS